MPKQVKLALAVVLLLVVGVIVAWVNGAFEGKPKPPPDPTAGYTPEQKQQLQKENQQRTEWEKKQKPPSGA